MVMLALTGPKADLMILGRNTNHHELGSEISRQAGAGSLCRLMKILMSRSGCGKIDKTSPTFRRLLFGGFYREKLPTVYPLVIGITASMGIHIKITQKTKQKNGMGYFFVFFVFLHGLVVCGFLADRGTAKQRSSWTLGAGFQHLSGQLITTKTLRSPSMVVKSKGNFPQMQV